MDENNLAHNCVPCEPGIYLAAALTLAGRCPPPISSVMMHLSQTRGARFRITGGRVDDRGGLDELDVDASDRNALWTSPPVTSDVMTASVTVIGCAVVSVPGSSRRCS
jgi:hypothetical protein